MLTDVRAPQNNLPANVASFIGRERELEEIARLLDDYRLVTLTGPGGTGKTRLAIQAAAAGQGRFPDGVWLIELGPLTEPELVVETITKVTHTPVTHERSPLEGLGAFIGERRMLLVLDNCEHLLAECAHVVARLLARCPALVILATSREPLATGGEWTLRVPPLSLPSSADALAPERILDYDGIRLFMERAHAAEPSFRLTEATAASVVEICRRLDGIPLALELAAMRVRGMGVAYLSNRLDNRFGLLTGGDRAGEQRQQTLLATVEWSYSLLSERERAVLRRLGVFIGSFSPEAAEAVCADAGEGERGAMAPASTVFDDLTRLVDKSLAQFDLETGSYRLLETIRLYCRDQLEAAGETNHVTRQHFVYYLQLAEDGGALVGGPGQEAWYTRLEREHDNFRAALAWAIHAGRSDEAAQMALGLWRFWHAHVYHLEGIRWLEQIYALDATRPLPDAVRPRLSNALGVLYHLGRSFDRATACHAEALRLWTEAGDQAGMAQALLDMGWKYFDEAQLDEARQYPEKSLALAERIGDERLIASALYLEATIDSELRPASDLIAPLERCLAIWRKLGDLGSQASTIAVLASVYRQVGDYERAKALLADAARLQTQIGNYGDLIGVLVILFRLVADTRDQLEDPYDGARALGSLLAWEAATGAGQSPWMTTESVRAMVDQVTGGLDPERVAQALAEGKRLTSAEFLALVERVTKPTQAATPATPAAPPHAQLTRREMEVLHLVAVGMTNAQVAQELFVTPRTVNAHLTAIYAKLGVVSRSGAIRYAVERQLA
ncbi:MAG: tetratricopeptide repeat protein [Chloroflexota bacterium]|nr:tetratricopeptide repeat protein [Chloroflexota bacterium]